VGYNCCDDTGLGAHFTITVLNKGGCMGKNWKIKGGEMWMRSDKGEWINERIARLFYTDLYNTRLGELV